ncbi:unknown [Candidatus Colimorpha enterica]|uniref:Uncharacterized protein n=1 Tax=Candidatus Colimorpha enterica TaxID=3083063 RepID=R6TEY9_9BACT|nr:unknown [Candidatus Colimorpha enterica]
MRRDKRRHSVKLPAAKAQIRQHIVGGEFYRFVGVSRRAHPGAEEYHAPLQPVVKHSVAPEERYKHLCVRNINPSGLLRHVGVPVFPIERNAVSPRVIGQPPADVAALLYAGGYRFKRSPCVERCALTDIYGRVPSALKRDIDRHLGRYRLHRRIHHPQCRGIVSCEPDKVGFSHIIVFRRTVYSGADGVSPGIGGYPSRRRVPDGKKIADRTEGVYPLVGCGVERRTVPAG